MSRLEDVGNLRECFDEKKEGERETDIEKERERETDSSRQIPSS